MNSNFTSSNNSNSFRLERSIFIWFGAIVNFLFVILNFHRYFRSKAQRIYLIYFYYCSLTFSLIFSLISSPLSSLIDYFWLNFSMISDQTRTLSCHFHLIFYFLSTTGVGYSIIYASFERTFFIFYSQNLRLTLIRQISPLALLFVLLFFVSILVVLLSPLTNESFLCLYRPIDLIRFEIFSFCFQFFLPLILMFISTFLLLYHIEIHTQRLRLSINRQRSRKKFHRILLHLSFYNFFYLFAVGPMNFYSFVRIFLPRKIRLFDFLFLNQIYLSLHFYPLLVFYLERTKKRRQTQTNSSPFVVVIPQQEDEYQRTRF